MATLLARDRKRRNMVHGDIAAELTRLIEVNHQLLEVVRRLVSLTESEPASSHAGPSPTVAVAAKPFSEIAAVRDFAAQLAALDSVQEVELRGFEGDLGAVLEVRLGGSTA